MSETAFPWMIDVYKGENQMIMVPTIDHIGGFSVCSAEYQVVKKLMMIKACTRR